MALTIHAHHLLVPRNNSCLHRCHAFRIGDDPFGADLGFAETSFERAARFVAAEHPKRFRLRPECGNVCRHVARAAKAFTLLFKINHRHCRFRREKLRSWSFNELSACRAICRTPLPWGAAQNAGIKRSAICEGPELSPSPIQC